MDKVEFYFALFNDLLIMVPESLRNGLSRKLLLSTKSPDVNLYKVIDVTDINSNELSNNRIIFYLFLDCENIFKLNCYINISRLRWFLMIVLGPLNWRDTTSTPRVYSN